MPATIRKPPCSNIQASRSEISKMAHEKKKVARYAPTTQASCPARVRTGPYMRTATARMIPANSECARVSVP